MYEGISYAETIVGEEVDLFSSIFGLQVDTLKKKWYNNPWIWAGIALGLAVLSAFTFNMGK
jgi:hypothetical protein